MRWEPTAGTKTKSKMTGRLLIVTTPEWNKTHWVPVQTFPHFHNKFLCQFVCFSRWHKGFDHFRPYRLIANISDRLTEINGRGRNRKQRKQMVTSRNDCSCYWWHQRNRVLSLPNTLFFLPAIFGLKCIPSEDS